MNEDLTDLTVADLRRALADLPADAPVRVESQAVGVSPTIGFIRLEPCGEPWLVLAHLCSAELCAAVRRS